MNQENLLLGQKKGHSIYRVTQLDPLVLTILGRQALEIVIMEDFSLA